MTKSSHSGQGARAGVECALLASMGFTGSPDVFGKGGFFEALIGGENQPELLIKDFGAPYRMVSPGVGFKKYPSSYASSDERSVGKEGVNSFRYRWSPYH